MNTGDLDRVKERKNNSTHFLLDTKDRDRSVLLGRIYRAHPTPPGSSRVSCSGAEVDWLNYVVGTDGFMLQMMSRRNTFWKKKVLELRRPVID